MPLAPIKCGGISQLGGGVLNVQGTSSAKVVAKQHAGLSRSVASWCAASFAVTSFCGFVAAATVAAAGSMGVPKNFAPIYAVSVRTGLRTGAVRTAWFAVYQRVYQCLVTSG